MKIEHMKIELPNSFFELGLIKLKEPISIELYYVDRRQHRAYFTWDFGMDCEVFLNSFMLTSRVTSRYQRLKNKVLMQIKYDLGHAFFHYEGDPNYTHYHWALAGWLKDRVEAVDESADWKDWAD